jgi:hypothetical protein
LYQAVRQGEPVTDVPIGQNGTRQVLYALMHVDQHVTGLSAWKETGST